MGLYDDDGIDLYPSQEGDEERPFEGGDVFNGMNGSQNRRFKVNNMLANPWKGAEAMHFLLLAQRQLYEGKLLL